MSKSRSRELAGWALIVVMVVGSLGLWLAVPLVWLWIASQITQSLQASITAYAAVAVGIPATMIALFSMLRRIDLAHQSLTGTARREQPAPPPWRRSMRDERKPRTMSTALDVILVTTAIVAGLVLLVWFLFFAGSPLPR